jgi:N-acetylmuramoyl-L-alanine amidase
VTVQLSAAAASPRGETTRARPGARVAGWACGRVRAVSAWVGVALALSFVAPPIAGAEPKRFRTVVIDAGHGGEDTGALGAGGLAEKELVLDVSLRIAKRLRSRGLEVSLTRSDDHFVPLETRTSLANDARADLFVSIHANSARSRKPSGIETYFVSIDATDESARQLAQRENEAFGSAAAQLGAVDPLMALLGDMIVTEHVNESSEFSKLVQAELADVDSGTSRGVKQAPFVVLMGVQMPASLIEIGFLSNPHDEAALGSSGHRGEIADAVARAVLAFAKRYDARRGIASDLSQATPSR